MFKYLSIAIVLGLGIFVFQNCAISADPDSEVNVISPIDNDGSVSVQNYFAHTGITPIYKIDVSDSNQQIYATVPDEIITSNGANKNEVLWRLDDTNGTPFSLNLRGSRIDLLSAERNFSLFFEGKITAFTPDNKILGYYFLSDKDHLGTPAFIIDIQNGSGPR